MIDFICIGGQRCGTTWLRQNLRRHPNIRTSPAEVHFWDSPPPRRPREWVSKFDDAPEGMKCGDFTPAYALLPAKVVVKISEWVPDARIIFNIRNPLARAWSAAMMFADRIQMDPEEPSDAWFEDVLRSRRCRAKSTYSVTLDIWSNFFDISQFVLPVYDDIETQPVTVLQQVATHLGVDPDHFARRPELAEFERGIVTAGQRAPSPAIVELLRDLHGDEVTRMSERLQRDFSPWLAWDGT